MELPDDAPKLSKLPFLIADAVLIAAAIYVAQAAGSPLPAPAIYAITGCIALGALLAAVPFIVDYNRRQEILLADRQQAIEALARTTSATVEQASIAANGLHEITEQAQKTLRIAEHLPQKLQEQINEFQRSRDEAAAAELESLQQELNTLRASEAEKLESLVEKVQRATAELAKVEAALRKQGDQWDQAAKRAGDTLIAASTAALSQIDQHLTRGVHQNAGASESARSVAPARPADPTPAAPLSPPPAPPEVASPAIAEPAAPDPATAGATPDVPVPATVAAAAPSASRRGTSKKRVVDTNPPLLPESFFNDAAPVEAGFPAAPHSKSPFSEGTDPRPETVQLAPEARTPPLARSADGVTRIVATAYIGIGNKLFIRGEGPGLSWDEGVPLQFVSIGKWRWETAEAEAPVVARLYKNDQVECSTLGEIRLEPGQQREVVATF